MTAEVFDEGAPGHLHPDQYEKALVSTTSEYCVRVMVAYAGACDGDFLMAMVFLSISLGCTQHLRNRAAKAEDFDGRFYRDSLRRPVSISSIARSLNVPIETVRRKCARLAELGLLDRTPSGQVVVTSASLARSDIGAVVTDNVTALRIMLDQIERMPAAFR
ncbi:hypothetical protein [Brevundimonas sp.]|uniref:hypothetical protein n=1 Tax=Brevundimonas sp. TaxID=1871086 RepID=UPI003D0B5425